MDAQEHSTKKKTKVRVKPKRPVKPRAKPLMLSGLAVLLLVLAGFIANEILTSKPAADWQEVSAKAGSYLQLPKDDAPHNSPMEWWYYNGHLKTTSGKNYSFHYTVFFVNGLSTHSVSHVSLADHQLQKNYTAQIRTAGGSSDSTTQNGFLFNHSGWLMSGADGIDQLKAGSDQFAFDLKLASSRAPVLQGKGGIITMENAGDSYYYSRPRLDVSGTLKIHGNTEAVTGTAWFDHQWGELRTTAITWTWLGLMLDDGSDLMIYQFYDNTGKHLMNTGTLSKDGVTELLPDTGIKLTPLETWTSKKSGLRYPVQWKLELPTQHIILTTKAVVNDSEFDARLTTYNIYWEGAVTVAGDRTGKGFVEMNTFKH